MSEDTYVCLQQKSFIEIHNDIHRLIGSNYKGNKNADFYLLQKNKNKKKRHCSIMIWTSAFAHYFS